MQPTASAPRCGPQADGSHRFALLHLNDTYRIEGLIDGRGGMARVRTLVADLRATCPGALVTHAGDLLSPSLPSKVFHGSQMTDVLGRLDGAPGVRDPATLVTFGNHEFDWRKPADAAPLAEVVRDSEFTWLDTNLTWTDPVLQGLPTVEDTVLIDHQGLTVGVFGLTIDSAVPPYVAIDTAYEAIARDRSATLRAAGARAIIAITHLRREDDMALLRALGPDGPDLIVGGHDHSASTDMVDGRYVLKGDADAARVQVVELVVSREGAVQATPRLVDVDERVPADPDVAAAITDWMTRFDAAFCAKPREGCPLAERLASAGVDLVAAEDRIRSVETNVGNWAADLALTAFGEDADVALINSGSLRLNQDIRAGAALTNQVIEELMPWSSSLNAVEVTGAQLAEALQHAVSEWGSSGHFLQVAGLAFRHDVKTGTASDLTLLTADGPRPVGAHETLRVVAPRYLLDPSMGDRDGYTMLPPYDARLLVAADGVDHKQLVRDDLRAHADAGLAPVVEGRICTSTVPGPCLAVAPGAPGTTPPTR